jgi:hypothetical protein
VDGGEKGGGEVILSKRQREQLVELLRCAADRCDGLDALFGFRPTALALDNPNLSYVASDALLATVGDEGDDWQAACLEVASRVEEGLWP